MVCIPTATGKLFSSFANFCRSSLIRSDVRPSTAPRKARTVGAEPGQIGNGHHLIVRTSDVIRQIRLDKVRSVLNQVQQRRNGSLQHVLLRTLPHSLNEGLHFL